MVRRLLLLVPLSLAAAAAAAPRDNFDTAARDYVRLQLAIGEKEDGYIDAYYGPENLRAEGKAAAAHADLAALRQRAELLRSQIVQLGGHATGERARRIRFLTAQLTAAITRLRMLQGER